MSNTALDIRSSAIGYQNSKKQIVIQQDINLQLHEGKMTCLIGLNGCGKSTLMKSLAGLQPLLSGQVSINGEDIASMTTLQRAKKIAVVLTQDIDIPHITVEEIVAMGQYPHRGFLQQKNRQSRDIIENAINKVNLNEFRKREFNTLSDGEKQRVLIAKALAQDTPIILLDEPTAHLDIANRIEIMLLLHQISHEKQKSILISTHELDIALQAADTIWLMGNQQIEVGIPEALVLDGIFDKAFHNDGYFFNHTNGNITINHPIKNIVRIEGNVTQCHWTARALSRYGIRATTEAEECVIATKEYWKFRGDKFYQIGEVIERVESYFRGE